MVPRGELGRLRRLLQPPVHRDPVPRPPEDPRHAGVRRHAIQSLHRLRQERDEPLLPPLALSHGSRSRPGHRATRAGLALPGEGRCRRRTRTGACPGRPQLDAAVHWGPFLVLVEAKARQFRLEGQLGDLGPLRTDLKTNVADAFDQALRARRYLTSVEEAPFREPTGDRVLRVRSADLQRIYLVTVSLHDLGTRSADWRRSRVSNSSSPPSTRDRSAWPSSMSSPASSRDRMFSSTTWSAAARLKGHTLPVPR